MALFFYIAMEIGGQRSRLEARLNEYLQTGGTTEGVAASFTNASEGSCSLRCDNSVGAILDKSGGCLSVSF